MLPLLIFTLIGLFLNQFAYLSAIQKTNAGTATILQYVCPVGILIYSCIKDKVAPTLGEIVSIILAIGGTFLIATHGQLDQLSMTPAGLIWGLFSGLTYALYIILPIALIKKWGQFGHWCGNGHNRFGRPSFYRSSADCYPNKS